MKMMPTHELIAIIEIISPNVIGEETVKRIFNTFGDDYFMEPGGEWELTNINPRRKSLIEKTIDSKEEKHDQG